MKRDTKREKLKKFFKAEVLQECRERVDMENIKVLYLVNAVFVFFSLALMIYTKITNGESFLVRVYFVYMLIAAVLLLFMRTVVEKHRNLIPVVILIDYAALNLYQVGSGVGSHAASPATSLYLYMGIAICFLMKPMYLILLQLLSAVCFGAFSWIVKPVSVAETDLLNVLVVMVISTILGCAVIYFRMIFLQSLERNDQTLRVTRLYQSILDEMQTGIVVHDIENGRMFYGNSAIKKMYGITGNISDQGTDSALWQERGKKHVDLDMQALKNGASNEATEFRDDGRIYQMKGKIIDWYGKDAYVEYLSDVTDTKKFNEQLQLEHEELQRKYQEEMLYREKAVSDDIIASSRINLTYGYIEEMRVGKQDGYEKHYHYAMDLVSRIAAFTNEIWLTEEQNRRMSAPYLLERYAKGDRSFTEVYAAELKNGRHVWIRTSANLVQRPGTAEIIAFCYSRNITREKELTHILEKIMSFEYDEIYTIDSTNGLITSMAKGQFALAEQIVEGNYEQGLDNLADRMNEEAEIERLRKELDLNNVLQNLENAQVYVNEFRMMSKNGKRRLKQIRFMYLSEVMGTLLFTITDIDDGVRAEKEKQDKLESALEMAERANAVKTNFLASMSHEIRTPMNAIIGLASIIQEEPKNEKQVADCADKLNAASKYLLALLNDILDMSRLESGNVVLQHQEFDIVQFWKSVNTLAEAQAKPAGVQYIFKQKRMLTEEYVGDAVRLQQILINLISNAVKFTHAGGEVSVTVEETESEKYRSKLRVKVADTGIGISKEFLPKVFDVFAQEHDGNTSVYGGSGLGLAIARSYARMMDGDITVESEEGVGTTFTVEVWLDIAENYKPKEMASEEKSVEEADFDGKRILLVEDHPLNTMVATRLLNKRGIEVVHAENGEEAVRIFEESKASEFDAILMDIRMPVMDGIEATKEIRHLRREDAGSVPIIAMTANAYEEERRMTKEAGMNAHLAKPIDPQLLYETLAEYM